VVVVVPSAIPKIEKVFVNVLNSKIYHSPHGIAMLQWFL